MGKTEGRWWCLDSRSTAGLRVSLLLLGGAALVAQLGLISWEDRSVWVAHTHEVLAEAEDLRAAITEAETSQRGYLLTGDEAYLKPQEHARTGLPAKLAALRRLAADNPGQLTRLDRIEDLARRRLAKLSEIVALRRRSPDASLEEFRTGTGRRLMEGLREELAAFRADERELLQRRVEESSRAGFTSHLAVLALALLALAFVAGAAIALNGHVGRRRQAEEALRRSHEELDARVCERTADLAEANERLQQEVARHQHTGAALRGSEERYRKIVETIPDGLWTIDADGRTSFVNERLARMLGYSPEEMAGAPLVHFLDADAREVGEQQLGRRGSGSVQRFDLRLRRKDGTDLWAMVSASPSFDGDRYAGSMGVVTDLTERRCLEDQLRQAQKMEAVGQLAGGVAHDFNNLLTVILGYGHILRSKLQDDEAAHELVREVIRAGERAAALTRQLLAFSREQILHPRVLDLNTLVSDLSGMLRWLIGEDVELTTLLAPALSAVKADPGQVEQVLVNLAVNARDAMPRGGRLTIVTKHVELDEMYSRGRPDVRPGAYVAVSIRDTGCGMSPQVKARIFEPFFTTKGPGKGTGLGLAMVYGIVKQSGGHVDVESEIGRGTTFHVYLPREATAATPAAAAPDVIPAGTETVLLVEDEAEVRGVARRALEGNGYRVLEACDGAEALAVVDAELGPLELLVTDVVMPGLSGPEVAERLVALRPGLKVLYVSGYTRNIIADKGVLEEGVAFLEKPFTAGLLARKVREVLDAGPAAAPVCRLAPCRT